MPSHEHLVKNGNACFKPVVRRKDRLSHRGRRHETAEPHGMDAQPYPDGRCLVFLIKDLRIDWQSGERYFMQHLIDADTATNNGNWQWCASTGTDAMRGYRDFQPRSQSKKFDPDGNYIRRYVPNSPTYRPRGSMNHTSCPRTNKTDMVATSAGTILVQSWITTRLAKEYLDLRALTMHILLLTSPQHLITVCSVRRFATTEDTSETSS
ncbi:MAG: FAD-binding domain-containing protein [Nitrospira sp.]|nr:FAD-binding domain-containing protein [Nitrospira sp.]